MSICNETSDHNYQLWFFFQNIKLFSSRCYGRLKHYLFSPGRWGGSLICVVIRYIKILKLVYQLGYPLWVEEHVTCTEGFSEMHVFQVEGMAETNWRHLKKSLLWRLYLLLNLFHGINAPFSNRLKMKSSVGNIFGIGVFWIFI